MRMLCGTGRQHGVRGSGSKDSRCNFHSNTQHLSLQMSKKAPEVHRSVIHCSLLLPAKGACGLSEVRPEGRYIARQVKPLGRRQVEVCGGHSERAAAPVGGGTVDGVAESVPTF